MKYKNALEWARQVMNGETGFIRREVEEVFPELQESAGEKTCKWIIMYLNDEFLCADELLKPKLQTAIAWLEKQIEKPQVDGFDAELNALLKKYEHLPKEQLLESMNFYVDELEKQWRDEI